jgi:hypothetical protein
MSESEDPDLGEEIKRALKKAESWVKGEIPLIASVWGRDNQGDLRRSQAPLKKKDLPEGQG